jgi:hypothetical protein
MIRYFSISFAIGLVFGIATTASADFIDFSSPEFQEAGSGVNSYTDTDLGMTLSALPQNATITWNSDYGLGVDSTYVGENPEQIDGGEFLKIDFTDSVFLTSVDLTNFYYNVNCGYPNPEIGYYVLENGTIESFSAGWFVAGSNNGEKTVSINKNISSIFFSAFWGDNYSIKGIDITAASGNTSVPELDAESALALLFGCVLISNGRRRLTL